MEVTWNKRMKRIMALILSLAMVFSAMAPSVFAAEKSVDPQNLPDGEYRVGIEMIKPNQMENIDTDSCQRSMANGAINHEATVKVVNGQATLIIDFGYLDLSSAFGPGMIGHLGWLKYENDDKNIMDSKILEYVLDEDGNRLKDDFNSGDVSDAMKHDYPSKVSFPIPDYAMKGENGFINCQVFVSVMEGIMAGCGTQDVTVRLAWNGGWTEAKNQETQENEKINFEPLKVVKQYQNIVDEDTEVSISGMLPADAKLSAKKIEDDSELEAIAKKDNLEIISAFDVNLDKALEGPVELVLPVDGALNGEKVAVYHVHDADNIDKNEVIVNEGSIQLTIDSFSKFLIAKEKAEEPKEPKEPAKQEETKLDFANLEDGIYTVTGEMIKTDKKTNSMANKGFDKNVKLEVKDGQYYVTLSFKGIKIGDKLGYLGEMKAFDDNGNLKDVEVIETVKYDGKTYPSKVRIKLNTEGRTEGWQKLQIFVQTMEDISKGCGTQKVYLRLHPETVKAEYNPEDTNFGGDTDKAAAKPAAPKTGDDEGAAGLGVTLVVMTIALAVVSKRKEKHNR